LSEQVDADLVHVHTWYAHLGGILAKTLYGIPLVHTVHSLEPLRPWKREQLGCGYDMSSWIERTSLGMADAVIAVSQGTKADILEHFDIDPAKITVIYNGINVDQYHPTDETTALEKYGVDPQADRPLCRPHHAPEGHRPPGQCGQVHQPRRAGRALCRRARYQGGAGRDGSRGQARSAGGFQERDLDPGDGHQGRGDRALFARHGLLLSVDLRAFRDHQPRSHGLPHGRRGQCRRRHQGGRRRWRHRLPGTARAVARRALRAGQPRRLLARSGDAINKVLDNPELAEAMAAAGQKRASEVFSWSSIAQQTKRLYDSLVKSEEHMMVPQDYPRVIIEAVEPQVDGGRFPIKRVVGEKVAVSADIYKEGHDKLAAVLKVRKVGEKRWQESPMTQGDNDRWYGEFTVTAIGRWEYTIEAYAERTCHGRTRSARRTCRGPTSTANSSRGW
jgi:hypothetical protein